MDVFRKKTFENARYHHSQKYANSIIKIAGSFLWTSKISKYSQYFFLWASNIQHIVILIWAQLDHNPSIQQENISLSIIKICKTILLKDFINPGENSLMVFVYAYFLVILAMMILLFYQIVRKGVLSQKERYINFIFSQFHLSIAFWSTSILLLDALLTNQQFKATMFGLPFDSGFLKVINIILLVLNMIISLFVSFYSYDPLKDSNELSMHTPSFQVFTFISKAIVVGVLALDLEIRSNFWTLTFFDFGLMLIRHINFIQTFPYYEFQPLSLSLNFSSISLSISGLTCFGLIVEGFTSLNGMSLLYFECLIAILVVKFHKNFLQKSILALITKKEKAIRSGNSALKKVFALNYIMKKTMVPLSSEENLGIKNIQSLGILSDLLEKHSDQIYIQGSNIKFETGTRASYNQILEAEIYHSLRVAAKNLKSSDKIRLFLANYIAQQNLNILMGYNYIQQIMKHSYSSQVIAFRMLEIYQQKINENLGDVIDVKTFLGFESMSTAFIEMINSNCLRYIEFWKSYNKQNLVMIDLLRKSQEIEKEDDAIKDYWTNFKRKNIFYSSSLKLIYSFYLSLVRNAGYSALKLQQTAAIDYTKNKDNLKEGIVLNVNTLASPDYIILHVAMFKEKVGTIINISRNISEKLGWDKKELLRENINVLIPQFLKDRHSRILIEQFERDVGVSYGKNIESFTRDKSGNIHPCHIYACIHPNLQEELMYLAILRVKNSSLGQIILSEDGSVQGFTKDIGEKLGLTTNEKKNIREICENYPNLTFLNERTMKYTLDSPLSDQNHIPHGASRIKEEVILRLKSRDKMVHQYNITLLPQKYFEEMYYILVFNSNGFKLRNSVRRLVISNNISKLSSPKIQQQDYQEEEKRRNSNLLKIFEAAKEQEEEEDSDSDNDNSDDSDDEVFDIPIEAEAKKTEFNLCLPLSPTSTVPLQTENQETNFPLRLPLQIDIANVINDKIEGTPNHEETPMMNRFPTNFKKATLTRKSTKTHLLKKVKKSHAQESVSSVSSKISGNALKIEQAVYFIPNDLRIKILTMIFTLLIILTASFLLVFQSHTSQIMQNVSENVLIVANSVSRIMRIANLFALSLYFPLLDAQLIKEDRFSFVNFPSVRSIASLRIGVSGLELMSYNIKVRQLTSNLDEKLSRSLFKKFPVIDFYETGEASSTRQLNSFDLITEIEGATQRLASKPSEIRGNSTQLSFILSNSLDNLLVSCEEGINVIIEDTRMKFGDLTNRITVFTCIIGVVSVFLWGYSIYMMKIFVNHRQKMLTVFRRLEEKEIMQHTNSVQKFSSLLVKYDMDAKVISSKINPKDTDFEFSLGKPSYIQREKPANMKGVNISIAKILIYLWLILLVIMFGYVLTIIVMKKQNDSINKKVNLMVHVGYGFYYTYLRHVGISLYLFKGGNLTLRSRPFNEEFDRIANYLSEMDSVYLNVMDQEEGFGEDPKVVEIFKGNLCIVAPTATSTASNTCRLLGGIPSKGLLALVGFYRNLIESIKRTYDNSNKTPQDVYAGLNNPVFIEAQVLVTANLIKAYDMVNTYMQIQLSKDATKATDKVRILVIGEVIAYATIVMLSWWKTRKMFIEEKGRWRKILRLIPGSLFKSSKLLEAYLFSNFKGGKTYFE